MLQNKSRTTSDLCNFFSSSLSEYIPRYIPSYLAELVPMQKDKNSEKQIQFTVVATSERTLDVILKTPKVRNIVFPTIVFSVVLFLQTSLLG